MTAANSDADFYTFRFGKMLFSGTKNFKQDKSLAIKYLRRAAETEVEAYEDFCISNDISFTKKRS